MLGFVVRWFGRAASAKSIGELEADWEEMGKRGFFVVTLNEEGVTFESAGDMLWKKS